MTSCRKILFLSHLQKGGVVLFKLLALILCNVLLMAGIARAEHKLLITDVLDKGQVEAEASYEYIYSNNTFQSRSRTFSFFKGEEVHRTNSTGLSLDLGLGHDLQFGIFIP